MADIMEMSISEDIQRYQAAFPGSRAEQYILSRGISKETAARFKLGCSFTAPDFGEKLSILDTLVIPTSDNSYVERKLDPNCSYAARYVNSSGTSHFFNAAVLQTAVTPLFVVEGAIDALSIIECGGEAIALNSTTMVKRLLCALEKSRPEQNIIIAMDSDDAGKTAAGELAAGLTRLAISYYEITDWNGCKDANELLQKDRHALEKLISTATAAAQQATVQLNGKDKALLDMFMHNRMDNCIQTMLAAIEENAQRSRVSTGFPMLDDALGGGIMPGLYLVAAMSSLGKTTFVIQMTTNLAKQGHDVIFFSLEMSRLDLFAKNISRHTCELDIKNCGTLGQSTNHVLNGEALHSGNADLKAHFQKAVAEYSRYADKLTVIEGFTDIGITQVKQITQDYIRLTGRKPIVVIDYVQLLQPADTHLSDKQNMDIAIKGLKQIVASGVPVFAISSLNRQSYDSPVSLASLKETGNLEYSAEVVLALDFEALYEAIRSGNAKSFDLNAEKQKDTREVLLTVLKNRNGQTGGQIPMNFYPQYNFFEER